MSQWKIDTFHSEVQFAVKHMMVTTVRGTFREFDATLNFDPENPQNASVEATIQVPSIDTGATDRDNHLRSADFFDAENYPTITFKSTSVEMTGDQVGKLHGDLTIRGTTKPVTLDVSFLGTVKSPINGVDAAGFEASTSINREEFGLTWNVALETGGVLVGKDINITLDVQFNPVAQLEQA